MPEELNQETQGLKDNPVHEWKLQPKAHLYCYSSLGNRVTSLPLARKPDSQAIIIKVL